MKEMEKLTKKELIGLYYRQSILAFFFGVMFLVFFMWAVTAQYNADNHKKIWQVMTRVCKKHNIDVTTEFEKEYDLNHKR
jgi:Na+/pantothenate symporter